MYKSLGPILFLLFFGLLPHYSLANLQFLEEEPVLFRLLNNPRDCNDAICINEKLEILPKDLKLFLDSMRRPKKFPKNDCASAICISEKYDYFLRVSKFFLIEYFGCNDSKCIDPEYIITTTYIFRSDISKGCTDSRCTNPDVGRDVGADGTPSNCDHNCKEQIAKDIAAEANLAKVKKDKEKADKDHKDEVARQKRLKKESADAAQKVREANQEKRNADTQARRDAAAQRERDERLRHKEINNDIRASRFRIERLEREAFSRDRFIEVVEEQIRRRMMLEVSETASAVCNAGADCRGRPQGGLKPGDGG